MKNKKLVEDNHYTFDEVTRKITFITDTTMYKIERNVFATGGVDIDKIKTVEEYYKHKFNFSHQSMRVIEEIWRNKTPVTLKEKHTKCLLLNDIEGMKKYRKLLEKRKSLKIKMVK